MTLNCTAARVEPVSIVFFARALCVGDSYSTNTVAPLQWTSMQHFFALRYCQSNHVLTGQKYLCRSWTSFKLYSSQPCWVRFLAHRCQKTWILGNQVSGQKKPSGAYLLPLPVNRPRHRTVWCGWRKRPRDDVMLVKAEFESYRVSKPRPNCSFPHPSTSQRGWVSLNPPPEEHNRCVDALCASIIHCLSSRSEHTVCGPCGDKQNDVMHKSKQP